MTKNEKLTNFAEEMFNSYHMSFNWRKSLEYHFHNGLPYILKYLLTYREFIGPFLHHLDFTLGFILRNSQNCTRSTLRSSRSLLLIHQKNGKILLPPVRYKSVKAGMRRIEFDKRGKATI